MTEDEVKGWVTYHKATDDGFAAWLNDRTLESKRVLLRSWTQTLADVTQEEAGSVSDRLLSGEVPSLPSWQYARDYRLLGAFVRTQVDRDRQERTAEFRLSASCSLTGRPATYHCSHCCDTGYRDCYHPKSIQAVLAGEIDLDKPEGRRKLRTCVTLCPCPAGEDLLQTSVRQIDFRKGAKGRRAWTAQQMYDPRHWCDCPEGHADRHAGKLRDWISERQDIRNRENYTAEFETFNENG